MYSEKDVEMLYKAALGWKDILTWAADHSDRLSKLWGECAPYTALAAAADIGKPDDRVTAYTFKVFLTVAYLINKEGGDVKKEV